ncbi:hypothetical protein BY458DRAFT_447567 [Sporodiniella umbellata]|nr:hypothetical protein BY458DRAFT_447567 [Sporodiniella umbellata]
MLSRQTQNFRLLYFCQYSQSSQSSITSAFRRHVYRGQLNQAKDAYNSLPSSPIDRNLLKRFVLLTRNGNKKEDLAFLKQLLRDLPNRFQQPLTQFEYNALMYAYGTHNLPEQAETLFYEMKKSGIEPNIYTYNTLLQVYMKHDQLDQAESLFKQIENPDTVTHNTLLQLWLRTGHTDRIFQFYNTHRGHKADIFTYSIILDAAILGNSKMAKLIFDEIMKRDDIDTVAMNTMLRYLKNNIEKALDLYARLKDHCTPDRTTFNILLDICLKNGVVSKAFDVYREMKMARLGPDNITYGILIDAEKQYGSLEGALGLFEEMKRKFKPDGRIVNSLANMAIQADSSYQIDRLISATRDYEDQLDTSAYNMIMGGLARFGKSKQVQDIYDRIFRHTKPDIATITHLILAYTNDNRLDDALEIYYVLRKHHRSENPKVKLDATFYSTLIASLSEVRSKNNNERLLAALTMFNDMRPLGIQPSVHTYTSMLHACGQYRDSYVLEHVYGLIKVDLYLDPDIGIYNALIDAYNRIGDGKTVLDIWQQLTMSSELSVDNTTVSIVFDSCGYNGYVERARTIWRWLRYTGFKLNTNNYTSFIECLCREPGSSGFKEALEVAKSMSCKESIRSGYPMIDAKTVNTVNSFANIKGFPELSISLK